MTVLCERALLVMKHVRRGIIYYARSLSFKNQDNSSLSRDWKVIFEEQEENL